MALGYHTTLCGRPRRARAIRCMSKCIGGGLLCLATLCRVRLGLIHRLPRRAGEGLGSIRVRVQGWSGACTVLIESLCRRPDTICAWWRSSLIESWRYRAGRIPAWRALRLPLLLQVLLRWHLRARRHDSLAWVVPVCHARVHGPGSFVPGPRGCSRGRLPLHRGH